jgi:hypothetical protein
MMIKKTGELMTHLTTYLHDVSEMSHHVPEDSFYLHCDVYW